MRRQGSGNNHNAADKQLITELQHKLTTLQDQCDKQETLSKELETLKEKYSVVLEKDNKSRQTQETLQEKNRSQEHIIQRLTLELSQLNSKHKENSHQEEDVHAMRLQIQELKAENESLVMNKKEGDDSTVVMENIKTFAGVIYEKVVELLTQLEDNEEGEKTYTQKDVVKVIRNVLKTASAEFTPTV